MILEYGNDNKKVKIGTPKNFTEAIRMIDSKIESDHLMKHYLRVNYLEKDFQVDYGDSEGHYFYIRETPKGFTEQIKAFHRGEKNDK